MPIEKRSSTKFEEAIQNDEKITKKESYPENRNNGGILKTIVWIFAFVIVASLVNSCSDNAKNSSSPVQKEYWINDITDYNDKLVAIFDDVTRIKSQYLDSDFTDISSNLKECNNVTASYKNGLATIQKIWWWKNDTSLIDASIPYYEKYISYFETFCDFIWKIDSISDEEYDYTYWLLEDKEAELSAAFDKMADAQEAFAKKYNYDFTESSQYYQYFFGIYESYIEGENYFWENEEDWSTSKIITEMDKIIDNNNALLLKADFYMGKRDWDDSIKASLVNLLNKNIAYYTEFRNALSNVGNMSEDEYEKKLNEVQSLQAEVTDLEDIFIKATRDFKDLY